MNSPYDKYTGFTPGPWDDEICTMKDGKPIEVCTEYAVRYGEGNHEARQNARLIAAAPLLLQDCREMWEALQSVRDWYGFSDMPMSTIDEVESALNRISERHKEG